MRVKSRKPGGEFYDLRRRHLFEFVRRADDGVGDQMWQVAGDRQHQVVMIGRHDLDFGAHAGPERTQGFDGHGIGAIGRREDAPAVDEQFGETGIGAGVLAAAPDVKSAWQYHRGPPPRERQFNTRTKRWRNSS
jgi:hypothetical protein